MSIFYLLAAIGAALVFVDNYLDDKKVEDKESINQLSLSFYAIFTPHLYFLFFRNYRRSSNE